MAWNEPGGGGNRDPWSGGGGNQGPPDLDELLRKARDRINRLFGGRAGRSGSGGSGGGSGGPSGVSTTGILALAGIAVVAWLLSGIYIVDEGLRGVVTTFGRHVATAGPGPHWHWPYPIGAVDRVNVSVRRSLTVGASNGNNVGSGFSDSVMLTADENLVSVSMEVQYRVADPAAYVFRFSAPDETLRDISVSALREVVGKRELSDLLAQDALDVTFDQLGQRIDLSEEQIESLREQAQTATTAEDAESDTAPEVDLVGAIRELVTEQATAYNLGLEVVEINVGRTRPPGPVQDAFDDAVRAREDMRRLIQEAIAYKNQQVPQARGRAARISADAKSYMAETVNAAEGATGRFDRLAGEYRQAPAITRERLYLETLESVLGRSGKILIDTEGNQPLMYMPLERMLRARDSGGEGGATGGAAAASSGSASDSASRSSGSSGSYSSSRSRTRESR